MNSEDRAKALARLAAMYGIDPRSPYEGGPGVAGYLERPDSIHPYVEVVEFVGEIGPGGEQLLPRYFELRAEYDEPWGSVAEAEAQYDFEWSSEMIAVVDLDGWEVLRRSRSGWSFRPLPDKDGG